MRIFNYEKAYFVHALPAYKNFNEKQKKAHAALLLEVKDLQQGKDLNIPVSNRMVDILRDLSCKEIAELSRASYFVGHWKPSFVEPPFENKSGESWKIADVCDQELRHRLNVPYGLQIHEGKLRVTYSDDNCWTWREFGLATEKNIEKFNEFRKIHSFGYLSLEENARMLENICGDLWIDVDLVRNSDEYLLFLKAKRERYIEKLNIRYTLKLEKLKKERKDAKKELDAFLWLAQEGIDEYYIENCIYYEYRDIFSFGWRDKLSEEERKTLKARLEGFPYPYEIVIPTSYNTLPVK